MGEQHRPLAMVHAGRDWLRACGWAFSAIVIPRLDLHGAADEGRIILGALHVEAHVHFRNYRGEFRPRGFVRVWSDASEISVRIAAAAGQIA